MRRALLGLLILGCADPTRVDVLFTADPALEAAAARIEVRVFSTEGDTVLEVDTVLEGDEPLSSLPVAVRLRPRAGDAARRFTVIGRLLDADGAPVARVAVNGGYVAGAAFQIVLRFTEGCDAGLACTGATTCRGGVCADACITSTGDRCVDAPDGGADDGGPRDAGPDDADPPDGGAASPAFVQRHVPTASQGGGFASALGGALSIDARDGAWLVLASGALSADVAGAQRAEARLTVDGAEVTRSGSSGGGPWSAIAFLDAGGARQVDVELQGLSGATASLRDLRLVAFPIPGAAYRDAALENRFFTQAEGWVGLAELRFTPSSAGRHLVLAHVSATTMPATDAVGVRVDAGGESWPMASGTPPHLAGASLDRQSFFLARAPSLAAGAEARFALEVRAGAPSSNASHAQLIALDLGAFGATVHDDALEVGSTSAATPETLASVRSPAAPRDWIAIGSVALLARGTRGAVLRADALERRFTHALDADARLSYPFFAGVSAAAPFDASVAVFASGAAVERRETTLHLLGL